MDIALANNQAVDALFAAARKMTPEHLTWKPLDKGRSALEQLQENATAPDLFLINLDPNYTPLYKSYEEAVAAGKQLDLDACEAQCRQLTDKINQTIAALTPEQLAETVTMPWGIQYTRAECTTFHYWNLTYHLGQINYIQTLYGDTSM